MRSQFFGATAFPFPLHKGPRSTQGKLGALRSLRSKRGITYIGRFEVDEAVSEDYPHPASIMREMSKYLGESAVLCVDTGDITLWAGLLVVPVYDDNDDGDFFAQVLPRCLSKAPAHSPLNG